MENKEIKMPRKFSLSYFILAAILLVMAVFSLLTLCYYIVDISTVGITVFKDTGFDLIDGQGALISSNLNETISVTCQVSSIVILAAGVASIILLGVRFAMKDNQAKKPGIAIIAINLAVSVIYLVVGIIAFVDTYNQYNEISYGVYTFSTICYLPMIFSVVLLAGYIVADIMFKKYRPDDYNVYDNGESEYINEERGQISVSSSNAPVKSGNASKKEVNAAGSSAVQKAHKEKYVAPVVVGLTFDDMERLVKINELYTTGVLDADEFKECKRTILDYANNKGDYALPQRNSNNTHQHI